MNSENSLKTKKPYGKLKYIFGLLGANSLIVQVVLFRELLVTFSGNELSWGIFFATWLFSVSLGSYIYTTLRLQLKGKSIFTLFIFQALLLITEIIIVRIIKTKLGFQPNETLPIEQIFFITSILIFFPSFIFGTLFTAVVDYTSQILKEDKIYIAGMVYSFEAFGSFVAGILFSFYLVTHFTSIEISAALLVFNLILGYILINNDYLLTEKPFYIIPKARLFKVIALAAASLLFAFLLIRFDAIKKISDYSYKAQWKGFNFIKQVESKYGKISVVEKNDQFNFFYNNNLSFILPDTPGAEYRIHLPMTYHKNPKTVLMLGGLSEEITQLYKYPLDKITHVELDPLILKTAAEYADPDEMVNPKDGLVHTVFADIKRFVKTNEEKYDVIILNYQEPNTLFSNRYFTKEFYEDVSERLNKGGVFVSTVSSSPNYLSGSMYFMQASIYQTLGLSFRYIRLISSDSLTFNASNSISLKMTRNIDLYNRFVSRNLKNDYFNEYVLLDLFMDKRNENRESLLKSEKRDIINTDFYPKTYLLNILLLGEEAESIVTKAFSWFFFKENKENIIYVLIVILLIILFYYATRYKQKTYLDLYLIVFTSGIVSISMEILLLFLFQILFGYVYYKIGSLIAIFMLGLSAGSYLGNNYLVKTKRDKLRSLILYIEAIYLVYLILVYSFLTKAYLSLFSKYDIFSFILLLLVSFLTGMQFPVANSLIISGTVSNSDNSLYSKTAGRLYASDLFGACIGSLMLTLFLIPFFGVYKSFEFLMLIKGCSMLIALTRTFVK